MYAELDIFKVLSCNLGQKKQANQSQLWHFQPT